ncbi:MAG: pilus assembly protein TadG-related protein [Ancalomicrobiaceae bacterium]|nr:pilus assembly protein TadG-related protein [Ancalomicrobiaceae bacterium]
MTAADRHAVAPTPAEPTARVRQSSLRRHLVSAFDRLRADCRGATAIQFALMMIPIMMLTGASLSLSEVFAMRQRLNAAADQAALAAVDYGMMLQTAANAQTAALNQFASQSAQVQATITKVTATVTDSITARTVVVNYTATVPNPFDGLFGTNLITFAGSSTSVTNLPIYMDFYLLLDNSPSMSIGATTDDITAMVNATSTTTYKNYNGGSEYKCAFACHETDIASNSQYNLYTLAQSKGIQKRIDVVAQATASLMDTATATEILTNQYRAAVYTFGATAQTAGLTAIATLTSNLSNVKTASANIDVMSVPYQNYNNDQDTDLNGMLAAMKNAITSSGDGSTSSKPQKVLFLVSDGVSDAAYGSSCTKSTTDGTRCQEPINTSYCTAIKNKYTTNPIRIAVLYTTYYPLTDNDWYNSWIKPFQSQIATNMQACASPGLYFEVSPSQGISTAMNALFQKAVGSARITQ